MFPAPHQSRQLAPVCPAQRPVQAGHAGDRRQQTPLWQSSAALSMFDFIESNGLIGSFIMTATSTVRKSTERTDGTLKR